MIHNNIHCTKYNAIVLTDENDNCSLCGAQLIDKFLIKKAIRNIIDDFFALKARQLNLQSGDITPDEEAKLDNAVVSITEVVTSWIQANK